MDLCAKYRPKKLDQVIGQESAIKSLTSMVRRDKIPQVMVFTGPSGCGKTSLCRVLAKRFLKARFKMGDYKEINASISRGIDTIREIQNLVNVYPVGDARVWVIDEAHGLTKDAQNSLLKILEDASEGKPEFAYFMLCTTEPAKLLKTIMTRCNEIKVKGVDPRSIKDLLLNVCEGEAATNVTDDVLDRIVEVCEGSPRKALKILQQVIGLSDEEEMLEAVEASDFRSAAFDIVKALMPFKDRPNWNSVREVLNGLKDEDPEGLRRLILAVCRTHMLKGGPMSERAFHVFGHFQDNYFDTGMTGLVASCYGATFH